MNKIKKYQIPIISTLIFLVSIISYTIGRYMYTEADSTYQFQSNEISFEGSSIGLSATNVKDAVDQIYQLYQSNTGRCPENQFCSSINELAAMFGGRGNIMRAYIYDASTCLSGNEADCKKTTCYTSTASGSCPVGTIIDYAVNNSKIVRFHVLHDDGRTMTMQAQKNTLYNIQWYINDTSRQGPQTVMAELKRVTDNWTNVNPITITSSTTSFTGVSSIDNSCNDNLSCSGNIYSMGNISGSYYARLITLQEATLWSIGACGKEQNHKSCKAFMNNYLKESNNYCGESSNLCEEDNHVENGGSDNYGYWTFSARARLDVGARSVLNVGTAGYSPTTADYYGARAVVNVSK